MRTHPVFLRLEGRRCVIVGGDPPALAQARACLAAGGAVVVVAASVAADLAGRVEHVARAYRPGDLAGAFLAYASTRDPAVIHALVAEAAAERVLLNVIDVPDACTFLSPAVVTRGDLRIAVGTGGASPTLAAELRRTLEGQVGPEYGPFVAILGAVRRTLAGEPARADVVAALARSPLLDLVRAGRRAEIDRLLADVAGVTLARLGVELEEVA
ncbi:MAG TPA: bifunctional precorrin-2 dehydrogenase/sirohydrochlorin ferrochelatase [Candidatus Binatia bacterium]|nr:bifunctional precorrin-2 dehydrogenase/sirohydrochlorin ferrochelatase [Candidatus Binatia bacterium]